MNVEDHQRKTLVRAILIILLINIAIGIVVSAMRMQAAYRARHATLPDGSVVELLGTAVGSATFTTETKWQRIARRHLPARFLNWISAPTSGSCSSGSNSLTVYLRSISPLPTTGTPPLWQGYVGEDESGFRYPHNGGHLGTMSGASGSVVYGLTLRAYPRRQREFLLHLLDQNGVAIASLRVPNPMPGPFSEWQPSPLPQTQTNGPVTLTLVSLEERGDARWRHTRPNWHLEASDPVWMNAKARSHTLLDPTGNESQLLSRREVAWKVRTLVYREGPQEFAAHERLTLTNLALPGPNNFLPIDRGADCAGVSVKVLVLAGTGIFGISNSITFGVSNGMTRFMLPASQGASGHSTSSYGNGTTVQTWSSSIPFLLVEAQNVQADDDIQFYLRDDDGGEIKVESNGYEGQMGGGRIYKPAFSPREGVKFVTLQILVNRPLPFEFLVNPADVQLRKP